MKAAIISRNGLGDGLLMMIAAYHLKKTGYKVYFYHKIFHKLNIKIFFPGYTFLPLEKVEEMNNFDLIILEHFNKNPIIEKFLKKRQFFLNKLFVLYPTKKKEKKDFSTDIIFNKRKSIAKNILDAICQILNKKQLIHLTNGIKIPSNFRFKKFSKRVVLHPTSNDIKKNWSKKKFISLFFLLKKHGFDPVFAIAEHEKDYLDQIIQKYKNKIKIFSNFYNLTKFIFESGFLIGNDSGLAHLSSNLNIPTIVIAASKNKMKLWRPDFLKSKIITPFWFVVNFKGVRFKKKYWYLFISARKVFKEFLKIANKT